jgi:hypothetical protein
MPRAGVHLRDLIYLDDGNPDYLNESKTLLNFDKCSRLYDILSMVPQSLLSCVCDAHDAAPVQIYLSQKTEYGFVPVAQFRKLFFEMRLLPDRDVIALSLIREPRAPATPASAEQA